MIANRTISIMTCGIITLSLLKPLLKKGLSHFSSLLTSGLLGRVALSPTDIFMSSYLVKIVILRIKFAHVMYKTAVHIGKY